MKYFLYSTDKLVLASSNVRWLDPHADYLLAQEYWAALGQPLAHSTWIAAHEYGYRYGAIVQNGRIISCAAVWKFSDEAWEIAAVSTLPEYRRKGYSNQVITFITRYILEEGRTPVCSTGDENVAMIATAKSVGYEEVPEDKVWWTYPRLPDF